MIVFLDLETTGLNPAKHVILEVAAVITDDALNEIAGRSWVAYWHASRLMIAPSGSVVDSVIASVSWDVDPIVLEMHTNNGLWAESAASALARGDVDAQLRAFVAEHCPELGERKGPQLAGNTINFDRAFLQAQLPETHAALHYRNIDMTTLNEMARRFKPDLHAARPKMPEESKHRAFSDVEESVALAHYYRDALFR